LNLKRKYVQTRGHNILYSEMETAIKEMRDKMATADDDIPWDLLILLGGDGL
jgi:diacylglycerol kinase family enzyme